MMRAWKRFLFLASLLLVWQWLAYMTAKQSMVFILPCGLVLWVLFVALFGKPGKPQPPDDDDAL